MNTTTTDPALPPPSPALPARDVTDLTTTPGDPWVPVLQSAEPSAPVAPDPGHVLRRDRGRGTGRDLAPDPAGEEGSA